LTQDLNETNQRLKSCLLISTKHSIMLSALFSGQCCCVELAAAPQQILYSSTDEQTNLPNLLRGGSKDFVKVSAEAAVVKPVPTVTQEIKPKVNKQVEVELPMDTPSTGGIQAAELESHKPVEAESLLPRPGPPMVLRPESSFSVEYENPKPLVVEAVPVPPTVTQPQVPCVAVQSTPSTSSTHSIDAAGSFVSVVSKSSRQEDADQQAREAETNQNDVQNEADACEDARTCSECLSECLSEAEANIREESRIYQNESREVAMTARTEHLEAIVAEFAKNAVTGRACTYFNERTGRRTAVTYKISTDLCLFTLEAPKRRFCNCGRISVRCPVSAVEDVDYFEAVEPLLKPKARASLSEDEKGRLVMVFHNDGKNNLASFAVLLDSHESRNLFANGLKTLATSMRE